MAERRPDRVRGALHDAFWAWCDKGELRLQRCRACGRLAWPVVEACEQCGSGEFEWTQMSGEGRLASWCAFHYDYYRGALATPYDTILVELAEGPLFVSNPVGFDAAKTELGTPLKLDFLDCEDAAGPFRLPVFAKTRAPDGA